VAENAVWGYPEPLDDAPPLADYVAFYWSKLDRWYEEDEEAIVHPRDPYHRVDVLQSSRHVVVRVGGEVVAEQHAPAGAVRDRPADALVPARDDVRMDLLEPATSARAAPTRASRRTGRCAGEVEEDLVWTYREPRRGMEAITDLLCFFNERVDLEVDGELVERPETQWSPHRAHSR
jgi:uncharacterized protein (DUF427 family)